MPLYYYEHQKTTGYANLGDDLNPYLLNQVLGSEITESEDFATIGIGTLLNDVFQKRLEHFDIKYAFSTGCGYGSYIPVFDTTWNFIAVRGHFTRDKLKLPDSVPVGDGAILISNYLPPLSSQGRDEIIFIPHIDYHIRDEKGWRRVAKLADIKYLPPSEPLEHMLSVLANAKLIITSAMHSAIIADTLGTPWVAINSPGVNTEKWRDWGSALDMEISFETFHSIEPKNWSNKADRLARQLQILRVAQCLRNLKLSHGFLSNRVKLNKTKKDLTLAAQRFRDLVGSTPGFGVGAKPPIS